MSEIKYLCEECWYELGLDTGRNEAVLHRMGMVLESNVRYASFIEGNLEKCGSCKDVKMAFEAIREV